MNKKQIVFYRLLRGYALLFIGLMALACQGQSPIDGEWFLHEIQIPSNEEFNDGIIYDHNNHIVLRPKLPPLSEEDIEAFNKEFEESYKDAVFSIEGSKNNDKLNREKEADTVGLEELFRRIRIKSGVEYEVFNDSVLVLSIPDGYSGSIPGIEVYVIEELTKDRLVLVSDRTVHGRMMYVYGREEQPIKRIKHNGINDRYPNPIVYKLDQQELEANSSPAAVAFSFVDAILNSDSRRMLSCLDAEVANDFEDARQMNGFVNYDPFFSEIGSKLNILRWKPYLTDNYEVAVLYVQSEWFDEYGREIKKVYVDCVPSDEVGQKGFQDITRFGTTNVKVLVVREDDAWKVIGFK